jgi:hypothetical protein
MAAVAPNFSQSPVDRRKLYMQRWGALKAERSSWLGHYRELSDYLMPRNGRFLSSDRNRGDKRHNNIYDSTGIRAGRILAAGMMSGMTSPARPWFRLETPDKELNKRQPVKEWCAAVTNDMLDIFAKSNTYRALHGIYGQLGVFGTAGSLILDDFQDVIRHYPLAVGEYAISTDDRGVVSTLYREFDMTVMQMIRRFGLKACSPTVQNMYTTRQRTRQLGDRRSRHRASRGSRPAQARRAQHAVEVLLLRVRPEQRHVPQRVRLHDLSRRRAAMGRRGRRHLRQQPRHGSLGDAKQLQHEQFRKGQSIDFATLPPLQAPVGTKAQDVVQLPGGVSFANQTGQGQGIKSLWDVRMDLNALTADIGDVRQRINASFYTDLFLMISQSEEQGGSPVTAREIAERHEEKLLMLGPVLERLHDELLGPKVEITFQKMLAGAHRSAPAARVAGCSTQYLVHQHAGAGAARCGYGRRRSTARHGRQHGADETRRHGQDRLG